MIKSFYYKNNQNVRIYLIQIYQSFTNYVTYTFSLQQHAFIFSNILRVHVKFNINLFLKLNQKENEFWLKHKQMQKWMNNMNQPIF